MPSLRCPQHPQKTSFVTIVVRIRGKNPLKTITTDFFENVTQHDVDRSCPERLRLTTEWMAAVDAHSSALSKLSLETGRLSAEQRAITLQELERRQLVVEAAEEALDLHPAEHGC